MDIHLSIRKEATVSDPCTTYQGAYDQSHDYARVVGESTTFHAVFGVSHGVNSAGFLAPIPRAVTPGSSTDGPP